MQQFIGRVILAEKHFSAQIVWSGSEMNEAPCAPGRRPSRRDWVVLLLGAAKKPVCSGYKLCSLANWYLTVLGRYFIGLMIFLPYLLIIYKRSTRRCSGNHFFHNTFHSSQKNLISYWSCHCTKFNVFF